MTREEAIQWIRQLKPKVTYPTEYGVYVDAEPLCKAIDMAIEALGEVNYWHDKATNYERTIINLSHSLECGARMKEQELLYIRSGKGLEPIGSSEHGITYE